MSLETDGTLLQALDAMREGEAELAAELLEQLSVEISESGECPSVEAIVDRCRAKWDTE